jgi:hypothetical protein
MVRVMLLSPAWRLVTATLVAMSLLTIPTYVLALFLLPPVPPLVMVRSFLVGTALPAVVAFAIGRAFRGSAETAGGVLRLHRGDVDVEVPADRIAVVRPWRLPLPSPGVTLSLRSGGRVPFAVAARDPTPFLALLEAVGVDVAAARRDPNIVRAATAPARGWGSLLLKFVVFGGAMASILFYTHQHIAYGGTFGQYYLEGPAAWLSTLAQYWATTVILLVSYAGFWRAGAEVVVWTVAALRADRAWSARRIVEAVCGLAYYAGLPILLALRYLA